MATRAIGMLIDGGRRITVKNAVIRGYRVGILAWRSPDVRLSRNDVSYNWKPRLYSGVEKESLLDWMSYHQNDKDEWLKQGAGIYLADCDGAEIDHTTIVQGQNGLMLARSNGAKIWNNNFSFISGIGIGLYRASEQHGRRTTRSTGACAGTATPSTTAARIPPASSSTSRATRTSSPSTR